MRGRGGDEAGGLCEVPAILSQEAAAVAGAEC